jgi:hypothetical protein
MSATTKTTRVSYLLLTLICLGAAGAQAADKVAHVCVEFDQNGCPVNISDWDVIVDGETSTRPGDRVKWVHWLAVSTLPAAGQCSVSTNPHKWDKKVEVPFSVIFSPFDQGGMFSSDPGKPGKVESKKLRLNKKRSSTQPQEIPAGIAIEYKYTIFAPGCPDGPLDPRIRVR